MTSEEYIAKKIKDINFLDFGCSKGDSLIYLEDRSKLKGLGLDIDENKVKISKERNLNVEKFDILELRNIGNNLVQFVSMFHFLEHLYSCQEAEQIIDAALNISTDFIIIKQPFFDMDGYLLKHNLKLFWSHWVGHHNHMTTLNFYNILNKLKSKYNFNFTIGTNKLISNSSDNAIIPLNTEIDQLGYIRSHGDKNKMIFQFPIYHETVVFIEKRENILCESLKKEFLYDIYYKSH